MESEVASIKKYKLNTGRYSAKPPRTKTPQLLLLLQVVPTLMPLPLPLPPLRVRRGRRATLAAVASRLWNALVVLILSSVPATTLEF